jgi:undecaprenyl-diphosphatase
MTLLQALLLGIAQGLTEFIPVSSSAHLALLPYWLDWNFSAEVIFLFGVLVQMGTLLAVIVYFFSDLMGMLRSGLQAIHERDLKNNPEARQLIWLVIATIPAALAGFFLNDIVESAFNNPRAIAIFLLANAAILISAELLRKHARASSDMRLPDAVLIGLMQILALFPGISRSGSTISAGIFRGFTREAASRFSFLMSIPIMIGAGIFSLLDISNSAVLHEAMIPLLVATVCAAVTGYFAIRWLMNYLRRKPLQIFALYCTVIGLATLAITFLRN